MNNPVVEPPGAKERRLREIADWHAEAHDFLDQKGIPRFAEGELTLKQRIVSLDSRWAQNMGEPDTADTETPKNG